ncbi:MFS transporter [Pseudacidovorax sp. NFM-22]|uniref:MFS transporter n=1 Tax=Pseudacidovorax sp. NFM-22 TaxID=2744469 RepID=UPI001F347ED3|nr:MFS transporter [Pseudacidovorax sp. NFM-22]
MSTATPVSRHAAFFVVFGGVSAAIHLGKLPPALPALHDELGLSLVQAGFLLSVLQFAGMGFGLLAGVLADGLGARRCMLIGLGLLTGASAAAGAWGQMGIGFGAMLALRVVEGAGFLLAVMPGPALVRRLAVTGTEKAALGWWGAYMPLGVSLALLAGPVFLHVAGWTGWWQGAALVSAMAMLGLIHAVPADGGRAASAGAGWSSRLGLTLREPDAWLVAGAFCVYAAQWMAVIGFLPTIYASAGMPAAWTALLTAVAAAVNIVGNVSGGRLLQRGHAPQRLLMRGFLAMALMAALAFAQIGSGDQVWALPMPVRYLAVCVFSLAGGMVPATLFLLAGRVVPQAASTTVGLMQQASSFGQFLAPPVVGWLAQRVGGWHWTWVFALGCSLAGMQMARWLGRRTQAGD